MTKWEYKFVTVYGYDMLTDVVGILNEHGLNGWQAVSEFVGDGQQRYLFKRPLPQEANNDLPYGYVEIPTTGGQP